MLYSKLHKKIAELLATPKHVIKRLKRLLRNGIYGNTQKKDVQLTHEGLSQLAPGSTRPESHSSAWNSLLPEVSNIAHGWPSPKPFEGLEPVQTCLSFCQSTEKDSDLFD